MQLSIVIAVACPHFHWASCGINSFKVAYGQVKPVAWNCFPSLSKKSEISELLIPCNIPGLGWVLRVTDKPRGSWFELVLIGVMVEGPALFQGEIIWYWSTPTGTKRSLQSKRVLATKENSITTKILWIVAPAILSEKYWGTKFPEERISKTNYWGWWMGRVRALDSLWYKWNRAQTISCWWGSCNKNKT